MKVISIIGTRPQFVKAAIVSQKLELNRCDELIIHTGQHYDFNLSGVFFKELGIPSPDYHLEIGSGSHSKQTGEMMISIEKVLLEETPDMVLLYGDTNSTIAGALPAVKLHIPIAHVEAGPRRYDKSIPEEVNRVLTDHISDLLFAPTKLAVKNLEKEGIKKGVYNVGDVMLDIALEMESRAEHDTILKKYDLSPKDFVAVTIHRAENTDNTEHLENIWSALCEIAEKHAKVVFPVHPRTRKALESLRLIDDSRPAGLFVIDPISYKEMVVLEKYARTIITDSGGVQREGYFLKTPCVIPNYSTGWIEPVQTGWNLISGAKKENIINGFLKQWNLNVESLEWRNFFGDGKASDRIARIIVDFINTKNQ